MKKWLDKLMFNRRIFLKSFSATALSTLTPETTQATVNFQNDSNIPAHYIQNRDTPGFYVRSAQPFLGVDMNIWNLSVGGAVKNPIAFSYEDLFGFPQVSQVSRLKCVECWSAKALWSGFRFQDLIERVSPLPQATHVHFQSADSYYESYRIDELLRPRVLLVLRMNQDPLSADHGHPLRLIAPYKYGYKNIKYITKISFTDKSQHNYWADNGPYSVDGTIQPGIDHPLDRGKKPLPINGGEVFHFFDTRPKTGDE